MKNSALLLAATLTLGLGSCNTLGGLGLKQTLEPEVEEIRGMREGLEQSWANVEVRVASVESDVQNFSVNQLAEANVDVEAIGDRILESASVDVEDGVTAPDTSEAQATLEGADDRAEAEIQAEVDRVTSEGQRIVTELHSGIPTSLTDLTQEAAGAAAKATAIRAKADQMRQVAKDNPLMSSKDMQTFEANRLVIDQEIVALTNLADRILAESPQLSERLTSALTSFEMKVGADG